MANHISQGGELLAKAKKKRSIKPDLDQYICERNEKRYMTYSQAALFYSLPYYGLVRLAKAAGASWKVRKTAIVDLDKLDLYLEELRKEEHEHGTETQSN